jgi:molybdopterin-containing oxidoreductase family iron-sulfur binding subunit
VTTREGRPIKIDGNPLHPASLGGSTPWMQAALLDLYAPARVARARRHGLPTSLAAELAVLAAGTGPLWLVLPPQSSPALAALLAQIAERREFHLVCDAAFDHRAAYRGHALVCGQPFEQQVDTAAADVIVALDADWTAQPA